jgi:hypothetical protein
MTTTLVTIGRWCAHAMWVGATKSVYSSDYRMTVPAQEPLVTAAFKLNFPFNV